MSGKHKILITGGSGFIGTNLIEHYLAAGADVFNIDIAKPRNAAHFHYWTKTDILDRSNLEKVIEDISPVLIVHAAARADLDGTSPSDYATNTRGLENVARAAASTKSVERLVSLSSMLVCKLGYQPKSDTDYQPSTVYGESKAEGERILHSLGPLPFVWSIVRPTSIWGPWFGPPYRSFFEIVQRGLYFHPSGLTSRRNYGYIGNAVVQISTIANVGDASGVYYVGDYTPIDVREWAKCIALNSRGRPHVHEVPLIAMKLAAKIGDQLKFLGWKNPPLSTFRLRNLLTEAVYDLSKTQAICPILPYDLVDGVRSTIAWLHEHPAALDK